LLLLLLLLLGTSCGGGSSGGGGKKKPAPPIAPADDLLSLTEAVPAFLAVLANDGAVSPEDVDLSLVSLPERGTATVETDGRIRYEPEHGFNGTDSFTYFADDGRASGEATVHVTVYASRTGAAPTVLLPRTGIDAEELAVLVNDLDTQSVAVADYYLRMRGIPAENVVHLSFTPGEAQIPEAEFETLHAEVEAKLGPEIQAIAITWTRPYRVAGMSITSAFTLGFSEDYYTTEGGCHPTAPSGFYASESTRPYTDHALRPAMMLAGETTDDVLDLIDRGIASDGTFPGGTAWLVRTTDGARSSRWPLMAQASAAWDHAPDGLTVIYEDRTAVLPVDNLIRHTAGIFVYLTGLTTVSDLETNTYHPGAIGDHLTSHGGVLGGSGQMDVIQWLKAGLTGSYGTVREPCNYTQKFPDPVPLLSHYYRGNTLVEAYWKSVRWPGEGLFVGEPLARPFGRFFLEFDAGTLRIRTTSLAPGGNYRVVAADSPAGPFETVLDGISVPHHRRETIVLPVADRRVYRLETAD